MSNRKLARNFSLMSISVGLSRLTGLVRDQIFAYFFGATWVSDAFNMAFTIPNLLRLLFGEGALGAAFIPIYQEIGVKQGRAAQVRFGMQIISLLTLCLTVLCLLGMIFTPLIVHLVAPGFDGQLYDLSVYLTRLLFPYLFFIGLSSTFIAILNSHDHFFLTGLNSAFFNLGSIITLGTFVLLVNGNTITLVDVFAWGVLLGGLLQTVVNFPQLRSCGYGIKPAWHLGGEALRQFWHKFLPGVWGIAAREVNLVVDRQIASMLATGSISALNYGQRLMQLPLGIIGVTMGTAATPSFSLAVAKNDLPELGRQLRFALVGMSAVMLPVTMLILCLGRDYLALLFLRGAFDNTALEMSFIALALYSAGLVLYSAVRILAAVFYAFKNTKTPVKISTFNVLVNVVLNISLVWVFRQLNWADLGGLALATSLSAGVQCFNLTRALKREIPQVSLAGYAKPLLLLAILTLISGIPLYYLAQLWQVHGLLMLIVKSVVFSGFYLLVYMAGLQILPLPETRTLRERIWGRLTKR